jgi:hypothetical protein
MKIEIVTKYKAESLGITHSRLLHEGHGCWGESDNTYEDVVYVGKKVVRLSDTDLIIFTGESPNREVLQIISEYQCSDKLLEMFHPKIVKKNKKERYKKYLELKKEFETK